MRTRRRFVGRGAVVQAVLEYARRRAPNAWSRWPKNDLIDECGVMSFKKMWGLPGLLVVMCVGVMSAQAQVPGDVPDVVFPTLTSWRTDPVVLHDMNMARHATHHPTEVMLGVRAGDDSALGVVMQSLDCMHLRDMPGVDISLWSCDAYTRSMRERISILFDVHHVWSEASFYEHVSEVVDPEVDYDLDIIQWHHLNKGQNIGGRIGAIGADIGSVEAWRHTPGDTPGVLGAVIDSGIDFTHPELAPLQWTNPGEICGNGVDDDANGYIDDCVGWDFGDLDSDPSPTSLPDEPATCKRWHGTFIAGLSSGVGDNAQGISGVHWGGKLLNIKKHDDATCVSRTSQSIESVEYAVDMGVKIVQMSFNSSAASVLFENTLRNAVARDVVLITSAGNDGADNDAMPVYPGSYGIEGQVVVAATTNQDLLSGVSSFGAQSVDIAAPGDDLYSSDEAKGYAIRTGTSYAVPLVAGVASLVRAAFPELPARQVAAAIIEGGEPLDSLNCTLSPGACVVSGARLDAPGALEAAAGKLTAPSISIRDVKVVDLAGDGFLSAGERATISYTLVNRGLPSTKLAFSVEPIGARTELTITPTLLTIPPLATNQTFTPTAQSIPSLLVNASCARNATLPLVITVQDDQSRIWAQEIEVFLACGIDADGDGVPPPQDCRDDNPMIAPNLPELCDGLDNNCNMLIDDNPQGGTRTFYLDQDGDGFGSTTLSVMACVQPAMYVPVSGDCDDTNSLIQPYQDPATGQTLCGVPPATSSQGKGCNCTTIQAKTATRDSPWLALMMLGMMTVLGVRIRRGGVKR